MTDADQSEQDKLASSGESAGGAYPNPQDGKDEKQDGVLGHGGQTEIDYSGPDHARANAATGKH